MRELVGRSAERKTGMKMSQKCQPTVNFEFEAVLEGIKDEI